MHIALHIMVILVLLRYGGRIKKTQHATYVGWERARLSDMNLNKWGLFTLRDDAMELGYVTWYIVWRCLLIGQVGWQR